MPYKDPERKRQWEREHREQRNAARRVGRTARSAQPALPNPPAPVAAQKSVSGWKVLLGFAVGLGALVLAVISGVRLPPPGHFGGFPGSSNP